MVALEEKSISVCVCVCPSCCHRMGAEAEAAVGMVLFSLYQARAALTGAILLSSPAGLAAASLLARR